MRTGREPNTTSSASVSSTHSLNECKISLIQYFLSAPQRHNNWGEALHGLLGTKDDKRPPEWFHTLYGGGGRGHDVLSDASIRLVERQLYQQIYWMHTESTRHVSEFVLRLFLQSNHRFITLHTCRTATQWSSKLHSRHVNYTLRCVTIFMQRCRAISELRMALWQVANRRTGYLFGEFCVGKSKGKFVTLRATLRGWRWGGCWGNNINLYSVRIYPLMFANFWQAKRYINQKHFSMSSMSHFTQFHNCPSCNCRR